MKSRQEFCWSQWRARVQKNIEPNKLKSLLFVVLDWLSAGFQKFLAITGELPFGFLFVRRNVTNTIGNRNYGL